IAALELVAGLSLELPDSAGDLRLDFDSCHLSFPFVAQRAPLALLTARLLIEAVSLELLRVEAEPDARPLGHDQLPVLDHEILIGHMILRVKKTAEFVRMHGGIRAREMRCCGAADLHVGL